MSKLRAAALGDDGFTMIEMLMAIVILGIGSVAIVAAMGTSILGSGAHRSGATAEVVTRDFAESVKREIAKAASYNDCPTVSDFATGQPLQPDYAPPAGSGYSATVTKVEWWQPNAADYRTGTFLDLAVAANLTTCQAYPNTHGCGPSQQLSACTSGLKRITMTITSPSRADIGQTVQVSRVLVRRNNT